jgi:hypothetical protein
VTAAGLTFEVEMSLMIRSRTLGCGWSRRAAAARRPAAAEQVGDADDAVQRRRIRGSSPWNPTWRCWRRRLPPGGVQSRWLSASLEGRLRSSVRCAAIERIAVRNIEKACPASADLLDSAWLIF